MANVLKGPHPAAPLFQASPAETAARKQCEVRAGEFPQVHGLLGRMKAESAPREMTKRTMPNDSEPPIREFADQGTLWLLESPENLRGLVRLVAAEIADRLDFTRAERVNRSFIPDDLRKREAALLFRVPFQEGSGVALVFLLLEHQSQPDRTMGFRVLS